PTTPERPCGTAAGRAPKTGTPWSHGSATVTPMPRRTVRREMVMIPASSLAGWQELRAPRRRRIGETARRLQPSIAGVDPRDEQCVGILVGDRHVLRRRLDAEVARFEAA